MRTYRSWVYRLTEENIIIETDDAILPQIEKKKNLQSLNSVYFLYIYFLMHTPSRTTVFLNSDRLKEIYFIHSKKNIL